MKWALALLLGLACSVGQADTRSFSLVFAGDTTLDDAAGALIARGGDPLAHVAPLFASTDLRVANLECVVATTGEAGDKNYTFRAHPQVLPVLRRHLDGVTLANNHSGDYGRVAFAEMLGLLKAANLAQTGGGHNLSEAHTPWLVERAGLRVALLSYSEFMPRSFEADYDAPGIAWSEDEQVVADIQRARQQHRADLVLVLMHWGWENELTANGRQRQLARWLIDAGADAIIGGHPHVTQDVELYQGKPIIYSVGNFVMKETDNERQRQAWVLRMTFDSAGASGFTTHPVRLDADGIPHPDQTGQSPCWQRGQRQPGLCKSTVGYPALPPSRP